MYIFTCVIEETATKKLHTGDIMIILILTTDFLFCDFFFINK